MFKKIMLLAGLIVYSLHSAADTRAMFAKDGSKATVLMIGMGLSANPDAVKFYETVAQEPVDEQGKFTKRFQFVDKDGAMPFVTICVFSKLAPDTGTCTLTFKPAAGVEYSASSGVIRYTTEGEDALKLQALFKGTQVSGEFFRSTDDHLVGVMDVENARWSLTFSN